MSNVTLEEIRSLPVDIRSTKDTQKITDFLPPRIEIVSTPIGIGTILAVMAPVGGDFLNTLEQIGTADSNVKWSLELIKSGTFDIGMSVTRSQLLRFVQINPELSEPIFALLKVAEKRVPVSEADVRKLCWSINGEWLA